VQPIEFYLCVNGLLSIPSDMSMLFKMRIEKKFPIDEIERN
jgi:hypothetical protein